MWRHCRLRKVRLASLEREADFLHKGDKKAERREGSPGSYFQRCSQGPGREYTHGHRVGITGLPEGQIMTHEQFLSLSQA